MARQRYDSMDKLRVERVLHQFDRQLDENDRCLFFPTTDRVMKAWKKMIDIENGKRRGVEKVAKC